MLNMRPKRRWGTSDRFFSNGWEGECVEIDTLSGKQIRELLEDHIKDYLDPCEWERLQTIEKAESETLEKIMHLHRSELEAVA